MGYWSCGSSNYGIFHTHSFVKYAAAFFDRQRRRKIVGTLSPMAFERRFYDHQKYAGQFGVLY